MRLTKRIIDGLPAGEKDYLVWDDELPGLGIREAFRGRELLPTAPF